MIHIKYQELNKALRIKESLTRKSYPHDQIGLNFTNGVLTLFSICQTTQSCFYYTIESTGISENFSFQIEDRMMPFMSGEMDLSIKVNIPQQKITMMMRDNKFDSDLITLVMPVMAKIDKNDVSNEIFIHSDELIRELRVGLTNVKDHIEEKKNGIYIYGKELSLFVNFLTNNGYRIYNRIKNIPGTVILRKDEPAGIYLREKYMAALITVLKDCKYVLIRFDDTGKGTLSSDCGKVKIVINNEFTFPKFTYDHDELKYFVVETKKLKDTIESLIKLYSKKKYLPLTVTVKENRLEFSDHTKDSIDPITNKDYKPVSIEVIEKESNEELSGFVNLNLLYDIIKLIKSKNTYVYLPLDEERIRFMKIVSEVTSIVGAEDRYACGFVYRYSFDRDRR